MQAKRAAFIVEHDFIMATYLADKVIVFDGNNVVIKSNFPWIMVHVNFYTHVEILPLKL